MRSAFMDAFDDAVIDIVERRLAEPTTPWALVQLRVLGGAVGPGCRRRNRIRLAGPDHPGLAHRPLHGPRQCGRARGLDGAPTWDRLREIKRRYDPDNVFRSNTSIPPA